MKRILYFLFYLSISSCVSDVEEIKVIDVEPFHSLKLEDTFEIYLVQSQEYALEIIGNETFVDEITYVTKDSILTLASNSNKKWLNPKKSKIVLKIYSPDLKKIESHKTAIIRSEDTLKLDEFGIVFEGRANIVDIKLECQDFYFWNTSSTTSGTMSVTGKTESMKLWISSLVTFKGSQFSCKRAFVEQSSDGDCDVFVTDTLDCKMLGYGNIFLYGNTINVNVLEHTGKGELNQIQ
ncbi:MAG: DUF2807 domain-containing protein [Flavobacteriales bacterium]|nr:DUF2807 domain-containing protein [Flavobacteriales bacterium]